MSPTISVELENAIDHAVSLALEAGQRKEQAMNTTNPKRHDNLLVEYSHGVAMARAHIRRAVKSALVQAEQARDEARQEVENARKIIAGFIDEDMNGVICSVPMYDDEEDPTVRGLDTPTNRYWCAKCQKRWKAAYAFVFDKDNTVPDVSTIAEIKADAQRDLLARVRQIVADGHTEPRVRQVWLSMRRHLLSKIDELAASIIPDPPPSDPSGKETP